MRLDRMRHDGLRLLVDPPKIATICFPSRPTAGLECGPKIKMDDLQFISVVTT